MRIGIDLIPAVPPIGGGWHYAAYLLRALADVDRSNEYVVFVNPESRKLVPVEANFRAVPVPVSPTSRRMKVAYEALLLGALASRWKLEVLHNMFGALPLFLRMPAVVTIYDLMVLERPDDFPPLRRLYVRHMRRFAARRATVLAPMSEFTAAHVESAYGIPRSRMVVIPPAIGDEFTPRPADEVRQLRLTHSLPQHFWLFIGSVLPNKNYRRLLRAYQLYRREVGDPWDLCLRGPDEDELRSLAGDAGLAGVTLLPYMRECDMPALYSAASGLAFPSLFEGGGIPVIEALACGCPVAASDIPPVREFAGDAAITFDPLSESSIATAMGRLHGDAGLRHSLRLEGLRRIDRLRPRVVGAAMMETYARAAQVR
jgi:glycosyltransferase involved in cell wall biosynthesis